MTVTANEVRRQLRRRRLGELLHLRAGQPTTVEPHPRSADLGRAMDGLPLRDRQILALRYAGGLTSQEIGAAIGLSGAGTRRRLQSVLAKLREELDDERA